MPHQECRQHRHHGHHGHHRHHHHHHHHQFEQVEAVPIAVIEQPQQQPQQRLETVEKNFALNPKVTFTELAAMAPGAARRALLHTLPKEERRAFWQFFRSNKNENQVQAVVETPAVVVQQPVTAAVTTTVAPSTSSTSSGAPQLQVANNETTPCSASTTSASTTTPGTGGVASSSTSTATTDSGCKDEVFARIFALSERVARKEEILKLSKEDRQAYKQYTAKVRQQRREQRDQNKTGSLTQTAPSNESVEAIVEQLTVISSQTEALFQTILDTPKGKERRMLVQQLPANLLEGFKAFRDNIKQARCIAKQERKQNKARLAQEQAEAGNTETDDCEWDSSCDCLNSQRTIPVADTVVSSLVEAEEAPQPVSWISLLPEDMQVQFEELARAIVLQKTKN